MVFVILLPGIAVAEVGFCFESKLPCGKTINIKLSIPDETGDKGFIRYKNGNSDIAIKKVKEKVLSPKNQLPATVQSKWQEKSNGLATGYYYLTSIGANIGEFIYVRKRDNKRFTFFDDRQNPELNCGWD